MKRLLLLFSIILLTSAIRSFSQDISPLPSVTVKKLISPNTPVFYYNTADSALWVFKGETGWLRIATNQQLIKYYVPYIGANKDVDLGIHRILAKGQLIPLFNGACVVPTIADNGDGSITVGNGEYHLSTRTDGKGTNNYIISGGVFSLTDNAQNYLVADYNGGTPIVRVISDVNLINETTIVPIFSVYRSGTVLHSQNWDALGVALANKVHQSIVKTQRYRRESGLGLSEVATRYLSVGSGRVWVGAVPVDIASVLTSTDNLRLYYHSGGVWTLSVQTQYNNTQYDNGTNLVNLTANRYAVNWIFRGIENQKHVYVVLGRGDYTLAQAQEAVLPAIPTVISSHAALVGKLIVQNGATTATSIQSAFDVQFSTATPNAHNDLTGRDVADVHPAGSITFSPTGTYTATTVADGLKQIDEKTPDRSVTNEGQLSTVGTTNNATIQSNTSGSNVLNIKGAGINVASASGNNITITGTEVDGSTTNEIQTLSTSSSGTTRTITISSGNSVGIDVADNDNSSTNEIQDISTNGNAGNLTISSGSTLNLNVNDADASITNEIQAPTRVGDLIGLTQTTTTIDISDKAPASGSGSYIWNGTSQQPTSNYNVSGYGIHGDYIQATTAKLTNLTDGYLPYHIGDASGLGDSPIYTNGIHIGINTNNPLSPFDLRYLNTKTNTSRSAVMSLYSNEVSNQFGLVVTAIGASNNVDRVISLQTQEAGIVNGGILALQDAGGKVAVGYSTNSEIGDNSFAVNGNTFISGNNKLGGYLLFNGTAISEPTNAFNYTQIKIQPLSGNKDAVFQFRPSGSATNSVMEFYHSSSVDANRFVIKNQGGAMKIGSDAINGDIDIIQSNNTKSTFLANGDFRVNNLSGAGTRLVTALSDGTLSTTTSSGGATNLTTSQTTSTVTVNSDTGTDALIPAATQSLAGVLNTVDKTKIDNIWNTSVQSLSGTTVTMTWTSGINATISLTGTTTLTISAMPDGGEAQIEVTNGSSSYTFNLNGDTGYTTEVIMGNNATINTTISSHTTVIIWRRGSILYYGFVYNN